MNTFDSIKNRKMRFWLKKVLWRHIVGIIVASFALFPLVWMISAAFDVTGQISTQELIPVSKSMTAKRVCSQCTDNDLHSSGRYSNYQ